MGAVLKLCCWSESVRQPRRGGMFIAQGVSPGRGNRTTDRAPSGAAEICGFVFVLFIYDLLLPPIRGWKVCAASYPRLSPGL